MRSAQAGVRRSRASTLQRAWSETSYRMQALRDNPDCAQEEYDRILDADDPGLSRYAELRRPTRTSPRRSSRAGARPRIAILREQGVNGQVEMAAASTAPASRRATCT